MKRFRAGMWLILGAVVVLGLSGVPAQAAVIFSDNFDTENSPNGADALNYTAFANWTVSAGSVDLIGDGGSYDFYPGNGFYVDLDGTVDPPDAGKMTSTSLSLGPGHYELKFLLGGNARGAADDTVDVSVQISLASASYTLASAALLEEHTLSFDLAAPTSANIVFDHAGGDNIGIILDNVRLISVPEPGTMALLGTGLFGLILGGRKKFRK